MEALLQGTLRGSDLSGVIQSIASKTGSSAEDVQAHVNEVHGKLVETARTALKLSHEEWADFGRFCSDPSRTEAQAGTVRAFVDSGNLKQARAMVKAWRTHTANGLAHGPDVEAALDAAGIGYYHKKGIGIILRLPTGDVGLTDAIRTGKVTISGKSSRR